VNALEILPEVQTFVLADLLGIWGDSFDGELCAACWQVKWKDSHFCRSCSIKLMRIGLLTRPMKLTTQKPQVNFSPALRCKLARHWDRALDYLRTAPRLRKMLRDEEE
jgi:hypothetical protein